MHAISAELYQLHSRGTFLPIHRDDISLLERPQVLETHMLLEKKRSSQIKARLVAGGDKQRDFISNADVGSPTCSTESVMLTSAIDAHQNRHVATVDIPNAFVQTVMHDKIIVCLWGKWLSYWSHLTPNTISSMYTLQSQVG